MEYSIIAKSEANNDASIEVKEAKIAFGITDDTANQLPNPAELFLGSFAACLLKNVERFSTLLHFSYDRATVEVKAVRLEQPPRLDDIQYKLTLFSRDPKLRIALLQKNLEKYGTIYNTVKQVCSIKGAIEKVEDYV